jgi:hypothetical protein
MLPLLPTYVGHKLNEKYSRFDPENAPTVWVEPFAGAGGHFFRYFQKYPLLAESLSLVIVADPDLMVRVLWVVWSKSQVARSAIVAENEFKAVYCLPVYKALSAIALSGLTVLIRYRLGAVMTLEQRLHLAVLDLVFMAADSLVKQWFQALKDEYDRYTLAPSLVMRQIDQAQCPELIHAFVVCRAVRSLVIRGITRSNESGRLNVHMDLLKLKRYATEAAVLPPSPKCKVHIFEDYTLAHQWLKHHMRTTGIDRASVFASIDPPYISKNKAYSTTVSDLHATICDAAKRFTPLARSVLFNYGCSILESLLPPHRMSVIGKLGHMNTLGGVPSNKVEVCYHFD